jgi:hypothetical protein
MRSQLYFLFLLVPSLIEAKPSTNDNPGAKVIKLFSFIVQAPEK